jgi:hypothetical protein
LASRRPPKQRLRARKRTSSSNMMMWPLHRTLCTRPRALWALAATPRPLPAP